MRSMILALFLAVAAQTWADTPPPGTVKIKGPDGTVIGNVGDALKVMAQPSPGATTSVNQIGRVFITKARNDYVTSPVLTSAWTQLVASMPSTAGLVEVFDSSGRTLKLGVGAGPTEAFYIYPGGNGPVSYPVPSGSAVSIRAVSATANTGEIVVNFYQ